MKIKVQGTITKENFDLLFEAINLKFNKENKLEMKGATIYINFYDKETNEKVDFFDSTKMNEILGFNINFNKKAGAKKLID